MWNIENILTSIEAHLKNCKLEREFILAKENTLYNETSAVICTYNKARLLFDPLYYSSIAINTIDFYKNNMISIIDILTEGMDDLCAATALMMSYTKIQSLLYDSGNSLNKQLICELNTNSDYYNLFDLDYYLEKNRTQGFLSSISELEADVNIRACTFLSTSYTAYLSLLPNFRPLLNQILQKINPDQIPDIF